LTVSGLTEAADGDLLSAAAGGDKQAFSVLVKRHYAPVYRLAYRVAGAAEAEDVAQDIFSKLWLNPAQVRDGGALKGWLLSAASNASIDRLRRKPVAALDAVAEPMDQRPGAEARMSQAWASRKIESALGTLPDRQRLALALIYFENMGNKEAAKVMDITVEAVESLLSRGKRALRLALAGDWRELLDGIE
jgi:RNA polymerase sigma-70 factor, ECF subfamily